MIKGLDELKKKISERGFTAIVNRSMKTYVKKVVKDAKDKAPSVITYFKDGESTSEATNVASSIFGYYKDKQAVFDVADRQGPYIEFGTGKYAADLLSTYPTEWQDIAWDFFENGEGTLFSYPYMYPAITENEGVILQEIQKELND